MSWQPDYDRDYEGDGGPPNHDDACMVCDKIDCVCPLESESALRYESLHFPSLHGTPRKYRFFIVAIIDAFLRVCFGATEGRVIDTKTGTHYVL